jgi:hypothetical protein
MKYKQNLVRELIIITNNRSIKKPQSESNEKKAMN